MSYSVKILADSVASGVRLTTMEATFPRFILAEFNTHRRFARNSASSRAIPVERRIAQVRENPFVPEAFTQNRKGMQADVTLADAEQSAAEMIWRKAAESACVEAEGLAKLGVHKQHANRLLEPYAWHTVVVSATEWENFFNLRTHKDAQPEMQVIAKMMKEAYEASTPAPLDPGEWHIPYLTHGETGQEADFLAISVARCAAVSYERQDAQKTVEEYRKRHDALLASGHMSPFEHQAKVLEPSIAHVAPFYGNFRAPWFQYRKQIPGEDVWKGGKE